MKRNLQVALRVLVLSLILSACGGAATSPVPTQAPVTLAPVASSAPATQPATLVPVDLAGPPMQVGSTYVYVDGEVIVAVPGGPFKVGYTYSDNPVRDATLPDFWIYNSEVTNQQYSLCVAVGKCTPPDPTDNPNFGNYRFINLPVVGVNWQQSVDYCSFVHARLPSELEWEKAARGPDGNVFPWGNNAPDCKLLNFNFCTGKSSDIQTYPDGVSYYGLFDMSGNVREWTSDWYDPGFPDVPPQTGEHRSIRSSSFGDGGDFTVAAHRFSLKPDGHESDLGFRCVVDDPTYFAPMCTTLAFLGSGPNGAESDCVPTFQCNKVSIGQGEYCAGGNVPHTTVTFNLSNTPPLGWTTGAPGCQGGNNPGDSQDCDSSSPNAPFTATATGSCTNTNACNPVCPMHYNKVNDQCIWDGTGAIGTECIAGMTYDPATQCCAATPGSGVNFDLCPDGFHPLNGMCVKDPVAIVDSVSQSVQFKSCTPGGGGGCTPPPGGCVPSTAGLVWCQQTCSCSRTCP